jgi:hypothetical protein
LFAAGLCRVVFNVARAAHGNESRGSQQQNHEKEPSGEHAQEDSLGNA